MGVIILITIVVVLVAIRLRYFCRYWTMKGVPQVNPWPFLGNMGRIVFRKCSSAELTQDTYNAFPDKRYYGIYQFFRPTLILRDVDLIKTIMIKEFDTFPEHRLMLTPDVDPIFGNNLFSMRGGPRWQELRSILSPFFTNVKLKSIFNSMQQCSEQCMQHIEEKEAGLPLELHEFFIKYSNDIIANISYGVTCNTFRNPDNEFFLMGRDATIITPWKSFVLLLNSLSPYLVKLLKPRIVSKQAMDFYLSITRQSVKLREEQNIIRPDIINILMEARKTKPEVELTDMDITANAFIFYLAGYETTARALSFVFYELALNPEVQKRLQNEIDQVLAVGPLTYETLMDMKYIDMVISEALRLWPPVMFVERSSVKSIIIEASSPGEERLKLDHPTDIWIPVYAIQRDPKYFPNPNKFDPERFSDRHKHNINPIAYSPFGIGPRNCIGSRFALLQIKVITYGILSKYDVLCTQKTPIPLVLERGQLFPAIAGGLWLELRRRGKL